MRVGIHGRCAILGLLSAWSLVGIAAAPAGEPIAIGQQFELVSPSMGETRRYQVHRPPNYDASTDRYPVLIVLDGEDDFAHASTTVDALAAADFIPPMIVIGIPNTIRSRDLIPHGKPPPGVVPSGHGGPEKFIEFIATELMPRIDQDYRTQPYRVLAGHSDGGLLVLYALIRRPDAFKGYVLASPAFGDSKDLAQEVDAYLREHKEVAADIYMTLANEGGGMLSGSWQMASWLQERTFRSNLRFTYRRYPEETHGSIPVRSIYDGLQVMFTGWRVADPFQLYEESGTAGLEKHYAEISARLGYTVAPPQETLFSVFNALEGAGRFAEAEPIISKAMQLYPTSATAYYYGGRLALDMKNKPLATQRLKKSMALEPGWTGPRTMLVQAGIDPDTTGSQ
jgi:predicted alpha/beta superfamily hydrolase